MSLFAKAARRRTGLQSSHYPLWDDDVPEPYYDAGLDDREATPSLLLCWAKVFLTLAEVAVIGLTVNRHR